MLRLKYTVIHYELNGGLSVNKKDVKSTRDLSKYLSTINSQDKLYHFTTFESLLEIVYGKCLKLNNVNCLNDKKESYFSDNRNYYIFSMTGNQEYVSMWQMYGKPSGIKIRIDFPKSSLTRCFNKGNIYYYNKGDLVHFYSMTKPLFEIKDEPQLCELKDVVYLNKLTSEYNHKERPFVNIKFDEKDIRELAGCIKYSIWEFERETRLIVKPDGSKETSNPEGDLLIDSVFLKVDDMFIKDINVTFNPWISGKMKDKLKLVLDDLGISSEDSSYDGQIDI